MLDFVNWLCYNIYVRLRKGRKKQKLKSQKTLLKKLKYLLTKKTEYGIIYM